MTQAPPSDILTRRVCLQLDGMDDVTVRRDVAYGPPDDRLGMDVYYPPDQTDDGRWPGAGRDQFPGMNASIDSFIRQGLVENLPITFVNHAEGPHAFDLFDDSRTSRDVLRQTLRFLRQHLTAEGSDASVTHV